MRQFTFFYTFASCREEAMMRAMLVLLATIYASSPFAEEDIYIYTSYKSDEGERVSHRMKCQDAGCVIEDGNAKKAITLTGEQRNQILDAFQLELDRFDIKKPPEPGDRLVKIKFRYSANGVRLDLSQRLPVARLSDVSPEFMAVMEAHFTGLGLFGTEQPEPAVKDEKSAAPEKSH
jgi:hypothetical protein